MRTISATLLLFLTCSGLPCFTQRLAPVRTPIPIQPPAPEPTYWHALAQSSGMIFSGTVLRVQPPAIPASHSGSTPQGLTTTIMFRVDTALRGVRQGQVVQIREWAGLWNAGEQYTVGERVLLFLYPNSKLGLTSPVGGRLGRYGINTAGQVLLPANGVAPQPITLKEFVTNFRRSTGE